jgi:Domain of unknown function (DUF932).
MEIFSAGLDRQEFAVAANGVLDPFELLSTVQGNMENANQAMNDAGLFGWEAETAPQSAMDSRGNIHMAPASEAAIIVHNFGPDRESVRFGQASEGFNFILPEEVVPLVDAITATGHPLMSIVPGPVTRLVFEHKSADFTTTAYSDVAKRQVESREVIAFRWQLDLGNNGKTALRVSLRGIRRVCANLMTSSKVMGAVSIKHSALAPSKIDATVQKILAKGDADLEKWIADYRELLNTRVTADQALAAWTDLYGWGEKDSKRGQTVMEKQREALFGALRSATTADISGTAAGWLNATVEVTQHLPGRVQTRSGETRAEANARRVLESVPALTSALDKAWDVARAF